MKTIIRLLGFLYSYSGLTALSVLIGCATIACGIGLLGTSAFLISQAALHPSIALLQVAIVGVRFFGITRGLFRYLERLLSHSINFRLLSNLRTWFFRKIEPLAPASLSQFSSGDLLGRVIEDMDALDIFYVRMAMPVFTGLLITLGMSWLTSLLSKELSVVLSVGMVVCGAGVPVIISISGKASGREWVTARSQMQSFIVESFQGIEELVSVNRTKAFLAKLDEIGRLAARAQIKSGWFTGLSNALNLIITNLTLWLVLVVTIPLIHSGKIEGLLLPVFALLVLASFEAVTPLGISAPFFERSLQSARRLFELAESHSMVVDRAAPSPPPSKMSLSIKNLTFRYSEGLKPALEDITLKIAPGKNVALVGPNGAGKTTLINLLLRFWDCQAGSIELDGQDIRDYASADVRSRIGYLPQPVYLFNGNLRQNLRLACPAGADSQFIEAIQAVGLGEWFAGLADGLESWIGDHGMQMSGGERQRLAIARLILQKAQLFLFDEPCARLDTVNEQRILGILKKITRGKSALWVTHHLAGLEDMDEIIVVNNGRIVERGTHGMLAAQRGLYFDMLSLQKPVREDWEL